MLGGGTTTITTAGLDEWGEIVHGMKTGALLEALIDRTRYLYEVRGCDETANAIAFLEMEREYLGTGVFKVIVEGHLYDVECDDGSVQRIFFLRRSGAMRIHDMDWRGPQTQEFLRALIAHIEEQYYLSSREEEVDDTIDLLRKTLYEYETRAYRREVVEANQTTLDHDSNDRLDTCREEYKDIPFGILSLTNGNEIDNRKTGDNGHLLWEEFV